MDIGGPFVLNVDPVFLDLGEIKLWYYGLAYAIGFFCIFLWFMKRRLTVGLPVNEVWSLSIIFAISSIIGGRVFEILVFEWEIFRNNPLEMLKFWHGGMASQGVVFGALVGLLFFCFTYKRKLLLVADELVIPLSFFLALVQFAGHVNGEIYGYATNVWWAVKFPYAEGFRHPVAIYNGIKNLLLILVLFSIRRRTAAIPGKLVACFISWYGFLQLFVDYFRDHTSEVFGLGSGQYYNLLIMASGFLLMSRFSKRYYSRKIDLNTLRFAPAAILTKIPFYANTNNYGKVVFFILLLLFTMTIPSGWSQEWLRQLIIRNGI